MSSTRWVPGIVDNNVVELLTKKRDLDLESERLAFPASPKITSAKTATCTEWDDSVAFCRTYGSNVAKPLDQAG